MNLWLLLVSVSKIFQLDIKLLIPGVQREISGFPIRPADSKDRPILGFFKWQRLLSIIKNFKA